MKACVNYAFNIDAEIKSLSMLRRNGSFVLMDVGVQIPPPHSQKMREGNEGKGYKSRGYKKRGTEA